MNNKNGKRILSQIVNYERDGIKIIDKKSLVIGIVLGIVIGMGLTVIAAILMIEMFPYTNIEDVCFDQTYSAEEYEKCIMDLRDNG